LQGIFLLTNTHKQTHKYTLQMKAKKTLQNVTNKQKDNIYIMALTLPKTMRHRMKAGALMRMVMMRIIIIILIKAAKSYKNCYNAKSYNNVRLETQSVRAGENFHSFTVEDWR